MVRLVLFDIDGTLIRTGGAGVKAFEKAFVSEFQLANGTEKMKFAGRTDVSLVREFFRHNGIEATPEEFRKFFDTYVFWLDHILKETEGHVLPGVWRIIEALKALPEPPVIGLLTGNIRLGAEIKLRHYGLWGVFEMGAFADDHEERDQIAVIARQRGAKMLGGKLKGSEIVVVGDTPLDIRCGRAIDAKVLAVGTGGASMEQLQEGKPDWLVEDLRSVTAREICE